MVRGSNLELHLVTFKTTDTFDLTKRASFVLVSGSRTAKARSLSMFLQIKKDSTHLKKTKSKRNGRT